MAINTDWFSCDGEGSLPDPRREAAGGGLESPPILGPPTLVGSRRCKADDYSPSGYAAPTRRGFLVGLGLSSLAWAMPRNALSQIALHKDARKNVVVSIFLRGGADGLNMVVPYREDAYHRGRPTLRLLAPQDGKGGAGERVLDLDGFFGLNPALAPLLPLYRDGSLAIAHAVGSADQTRSHFEAMNTMERGVASGTEGAASGWLARYLAATQPGKASPLRAVSFGSTMPDSLRGASNAVSIEDLTQFRLQGEDEADMRRALAAMYGSGKDAMSQAGRETLAVLDSLNRLNPSDYRPSNGAAYPASDLGQGLKQVALLIRAGVGLEVAVLDKGGWDTHVAQGVSAGLLSNLLVDLGQSLAAFAADLGAEMESVTVMVQTEFGRRLQENSGFGTDHGRAGVMFALGGGVRGGRVYADWPGIEDHQLEPPGDLRVTTDYRTVLGEMMTKRLSCEPGQVFDDAAAKPVGIFR